jgi:hypothetical protein
MRGRLLIAVSGALALWASSVQAQVPWPPPPGMTAGEYVARYGHRIPPHGWEHRRARRWEDEHRYRRWERRRYRDRFYDDYDDYYD